MRDLFQINFILPVFIFILFFNTSTVAQSLTSSVPDTTLSKAPEGWTYDVKAGLGGNFNRLEDVPGKETGNTLTMNADWDSRLNYLRSVNELRLFLQISEAMSRTPSLAENVLTSDRLKAGAMYLYNFPSFVWISPFASVDLETNLFKGHSYSATPVDFQVIGEPSPSATAVTKFQLTDSFGITTVKETVGGLARLWSTTACTGEFKLGMAAMQIFADDQLTLNDDPTTAGVIEVKSLEDVKKVGLDGVFTVKGDSWDKKFTWMVYAAFFGPFTVDPELADKDANEFTKAATTEYGMKLSFNPLSWLALSYELRNFREPLIIDEHQITHNVLATLTYKTSGSL